MARLVHGSTDLLQPINLLPNSDFSRSDGYPTSGTLNLAYNKNDYIASNVYLTQALYTTSTTATVNYSISNGKIHLSIDYTGGNKEQYIGVRFPYTLNVGKVYTLHAKLEKTMDTEGGLAGSLQVQFGNAANQSVYYFSGETRVALINEGILNYCAIVIYVNKNTHIELDISDLCLYEGAYTNPPVYKSLDVKPGNQFLYRGLSNLFSNRNLSFTIPANNTNYYEIISTGGNTFHKTFVRVRNSMFEIDFSYYSPSHSKNQVVYSRCLVNDNIQSILPSFYVCNYGGGIYLCIKLQNNTSAIDVKAYAGVSYSINADSFYNTLNHSSGLSVFGRHREGTYTVAKTISIEYPE